MAGTGHVYLIQSEDLYKIGFSGDPRVRAGSLSIQGKRRELIHSFPCGECRAVEKQWHHHFAAKRVRGEWFRLDAEDVRLFCSITNCPDLAGLPAAVRDALPPKQKRWGQSQDRPGWKGVAFDLPIELKAEMDALGERNRRTFQAELIHAIRRHLEVPPVVTVQVATPPLPPAEDVHVPKPKGRPKGKPKGKE